MTVKSRLIGLLSLSFLTVGGAALAAPGQGPGHRSHGPSEARGYTPEQRQVRESDRPFSHVRPQARLSPRLARQLRDADRQILQGQDRVERGRHMLLRGERLRNRQLIRQGQRLMEQGREQISRGQRLKMRILA